MLQQTWKQEWRYWWELLFLLKSSVAADQIWGKIFLKKVLNVSLIHMPVCKGNLNVFLALYMPIREGTTLALSIRNPWMGVTKARV